MTQVRFNLKRINKKLEAYRDKALVVVEDVLSNQILDQINKGLSPVKNQGRFQKYSDSYRDQIRNKVAFYQKGGRLYVVEANSRKSKQFIKNFNSQKIPPGKKVSPVNLKLSGDLHRSFFTKITKTTVKVGFDNELADIHNRQGAGRSKVIRRMLPTETGEVFNRSITLRLREALRRLKRNAFK